jgi:hypothetical protein
VQPAARAALRRQALCGLRRPVLLNEPRALPRPRLLPQLRPLRPRLPAPWVGLSCMHHFAGVPAASGASRASAPQAGWGRMSSAELCPLGAWVLRLANPPLCPPFIQRVSHPIKCLRLSPADGPSVSPLPGLGSKGAAGTRAVAGRCVTGPMRSPRRCPNRRGGCHRGRASSRVGGAVHDRLQARQTVLGHCVARARGGNALDWVPGPLLGPGRARPIGALLWLARAS